MEFNLRLATKEDCKEILRMIKAMAGYYGLAEQVVITEKALQADGFADMPLFKCLLMELPPGKKSKEGHTIIGYLFFYITYSSWRGRSLGLEDLYIMPEFRGTGLGTLAMSTIAKIAADNRCCRMQFTLMTENRRTMEFSKRMGAEDVTAKEDWHILRFDEEAIKRMAPSGMHIEGALYPLPHAPNGKV